MVRQLMPMVRFDGYHVLADAHRGPGPVPAHRPTLLGLLPGRWRQPEAAALKPWARAVVTVWVLVMVPLLALQHGHHGADPAARAGHRLGHGLKQQAMLPAALADGDVADAAVRVLAIACLALPVLGIVYILVRLVRQLGHRPVAEDPRARPLRRGTRRRCVAARWSPAWPGPGGRGADTYRPVQPYERGTLADAATAVVPALRRSAAAPEGQAGTTVAMWPERRPLPTARRPAAEHGPGARGSPARPATGPAAAAAPAARRPGSSPSTAGRSRGRATTRRSRSTPRTVPWSTTSPSPWSGPTTATTVTPRNEAYAFASCADCRAVAVGFQVVLIVGQTDVVVPQNLSAAVNYNCVRCLTYALASQLVLTLDGPLSADGMTRLNELWQEIADYGKDLRNVPLSEIQGRLERLQGTDHGGHQGRSERHPGRVRRHSANSGRHARRNLRRHARRHAWCRYRCHARYDVGSHCRNHPRSTQAPAPGPREPRRRVTARRRPVPPRAPVPRSRQGSN